MRLQNGGIRLFLSGFLVVASAAATAGTKNKFCIDPNGYEGHWSIRDSYSGTGQQVVELSPGSYAVSIGKSGAIGKFLVTILPNGQVSPSKAPQYETSLSQCNSREIVKIKFLTTPIKFIFGKYEGYLSISNQVASGIKRDSNTVVLVNGVKYRMIVGKTGDAKFDFGIDKNGHIQILDGIFGSAKENTLILRTVPIWIETEKYKWKWRIKNAVSDDRIGSNQVHLVPGLGYQFAIGGNGSAASFDFKLDKVGNVVEVPEYAAHKIPATNGKAAGLKLKTAMVKIGTGNYRGKWAISHNSSSGFGPTNGVESVRLVPGLSYQVVLGTSGSISKFSFRVSKKTNDGGFAEVVREQSVSYTVAGDGGLIMNTGAFHVRPIGFTGEWTIANKVLPLDHGNSEWRRGRRDILLVPGVHYKLVAKGSNEQPPSKDFQIKGRCCVVPSILKVREKDFVVVPKH